MARKPEYSGPWRRIRQQILTRDNHTCQIQLAGCTTHATQVDHITPTSQGGAWWDPTNLRASCQHCNNQRIDRTKQNRWQTKGPPITLIHGPNAHHNHQHTLDLAQTGDLIIDHTTLVNTLKGDLDPEGRNSQVYISAANIARNALLAAVRKGEIEGRRIYITSTNPDALEIFPFHEQKEIDLGPDAVFAQLEEEGKTGAHPAVRAARRWYAQRPTLEGGGEDSSIVSSRFW